MTSDMRLVISLNWVFGSLLFAVALLFPFVRPAMFSDEKEIERVVQAVAVAERSYFELLRGSYVYFSTSDSKSGLERLKVDLSRVGSGLSVDNLPFLIEAGPGPAGGDVLVIRALRHHSELRKGWVPPRQYVWTVKSASEPGSGAWTDFAKNRPLGILTPIFGG